MVERFHRQLKTALKSYPQPQLWFEALPMVLLGIRTAIKDDLQGTTAEMVYGTTLRLPGQFFIPTTDSLDDPTLYVNRLKASMQQLQPPPVRTTSRHPIFVHNDLATTTHVFVRHDHRRTSLQPTYNGPLMGNSDISLLNVRVVWTLFLLIG